MNLTELTASFLNAYQTNKNYRPAPMMPSRPLSLFEHTLYPLSQLDALIDKLKTLHKDPFDAEDDELTRLSARFVVEASGQIWFAREGETGQYVPDHAQMRDRCVAAGNITFSEGYQSIIKISNESGHFLPSYDCLAWPIAALYYLDNTRLADNVELGLMMNYPSEKTLFSVSRDELVNLLPEGMEARIRDNNQPADIQIRSGGSKSSSSTKKQKVNGEFSGLNTQSIFSSSSSHLTTPPRSPAAAATSSSSYCYDSPN